MPDTPAAVTYTLGPYKVNRIGYGAMRLAAPRITVPGPGRDAALRLLREAVELGVDHIDTAGYYGPGTVNGLIREALHPYPDGLALVSKVGARRDAAGRFRLWNQPHELRLGIEENLRTLGTGQLAAVNLRLLDGAPADQFFQDQGAAMAQARDDGLVAGVGLSNITREHLLAATAITSIVCVQNHFNPADTSSRALLDECTRTGTAFVPFGLLGSGQAGGNPVLGSHQLRSVAERLGVSAAQVALAWALHLAPNVLVIRGTTSACHMRDNLAAARLHLDPAAQAGIQLLISGS